MKYLFSAFLLFCGISSFAQDTTHSPGRSSVSVMGGVNRTAPLSSFGAYGPWATPIRPYATVSPCYEIDYGYLLYRSKLFTLGLKLGLGYTQNDYMGNGAWEVAYGVILDFEHLNTIEFTTGINAGLGRQNSVQWYNELDLVSSVQTYMAYTGGSHWVSESSFTSGRDVNLYLYYYSGVKIPVGKRISITPMVGYSLCNITTLFNKGNVYDIDTYRYLRGDIMVTYRFN